MPYIMKEHDAMKLLQTNMTFKQIKRYFNDTLTRKVNYGKAEVDWTYKSGK